MRSPFHTLVITLALLSACGNEEHKATTNTTSTGPQTGATGTSTTGAQTGTTGTSTTGTTGATGTTAGTATSGTSTGTETSTTGTETSTTGPGPGTTGGGMPGGACATDKDCVLHSDCCDCFATTKPDASPICDQDCNQPMCELQAISQAICRFGTCVTEKVGCNPLKVACDAEPPTCPMGQLPSVKDKCWTGQCVAAISCDIVIGCDLCPDNFMCVYMDEPFPWPPTCEPIPPECDAKIECECAGQEACLAPFTSCSVIKGNELHCACLFC